MMKYVLERDASVQQSKASMRLKRKPGLAAQTHMKTPTNPQPLRALQPLNTIKHYRLIEPGLDIALPILFEVGVLYNLVVLHGCEKPLEIEEKCTQMGSGHANGGGTRQDSTLNI